MSFPSTGQIPPLPDDFLAQSSDAINAEEIMATIRRRIAEKQQAGLYRGLPRLALDTPPPPGGVRRAEERLALLHMYARGNLDGDPIASHRPVIGRFIVAAKRAARFLVRRYTDALFLRQQMFNEEMVSLLDDLTREIKEQRGDATTEDERTE